MAKVSKPLLSLDAHGTLADTITYSRQPAGTIAREKPVPADRLTLLQLYHRWLYQDYAAYWQTLTSAQKAAYRTAGSRYHRPAFAQFLKTFLKTQPDIAGIWHLDERFSSIALDSSKKGNYGSIIGALHVPAVIDYGLWFDGINDNVNLGKSTDHDLTTALTLEAYIYMDALPSEADRSMCILDKRSSIYSWLIHKANDRIRLTLGKAVGFDEFWGVAITARTLHHVAVTWDGEYVIHYLDGVPNTPAARTEESPTRVDFLRIGCNYYGNADWFYGTIDNVVMWYRALPHASLLAHSNRRYPR